MPTPQSLLRAWQNHRRLVLSAGATVAVIVVSVVVVDVLQAGPAPSSAAGSGSTTNGEDAAGTKPTATSAGMDAMVSMTRAATTTTAMAMPMPVPMQTLGTAEWQGMTIQARATTPLAFVVFSGTSEKTVKPTRMDSMHLMVMLSDRYTGVAIPYSSVWATIRKGGKIVYDERQWPMLSRYMGPHYGNDVALPGAGTYQLTLLISPPQAARHMEYAKAWLKPHRVTMTFTWKGKG